MTTMKAIRIHSYGGPEVLNYEDAPFPSLADDDVLIRVHSAGVNPVDWKIRAGYLKDFLQLPLPIIPGWDVSGTIEEKGSKVADFHKGDSVYSCPSLFRNGAYGEYIAVKASEIAYKPEKLDYDNAAAVPLAALTAWQSLFDLAGLQAGQKVLIHAAAGGVGHFAVQFAKWVGAHVITTASSRNKDFLLQIGAHEIIDYTTTAFEDVVRDVDVVLDTLGDKVWDRSWQVLKKGGIMVSTLHPPPVDETAAKTDKRGALVFVQPNGVHLGEIAELIDSDNVKPFVGEVLSLRDASQAHRLIESGHTRGKIVLRVIP